MSLGKVIPAGAAVLAGAAILLGCGGNGGSDSSTTTTPSLTKAQFLKRANAICAKGTEEIGRLDQAAWKKYDPTHRHVTEAISNKVALALLPARVKELRLIRTLGLPRGEEQKVKKMFTAWEEGIQKGREDSSSLRAAGSAYAFYKSYTMGIDYGLTKCWLG